MILEIAKDFFFKEENTSGLLRIIEKFPCREEFLYENLLKYVAVYGINIQMLLEI